MNILAEIMLFKSAVNSNMILALQQREESDDRSIGGLFYLMVSELSDLTFAEAIAFLVTLFKDAFEKEESLEELLINDILDQFFQKLPAHYKNKFLQHKNAS